MVKSRGKEIRKVVMKVNIHDDEDKRKAMKAASTLHGINSIEIDLYKDQMIVIGEVDPTILIDKLKKPWKAEFLTVETIKQEQKEVPVKKPATIPPLRVPPFYLNPTKPPAGPCPNPYPRSYSQPRPYYPQPRYLQHPFHPPHPHQYTYPGRPMNFYP